MKKILFMIFLSILFFSCAPKSYPDKSIVICPDAGQGSLLKNTNSTMNYYLYLPPGFDKAQSSGSLFPLVVSMSGSSSASSPLTPAAFETSIVPGFAALADGKPVIGKEALDVFGAIPAQLKTGLILIPQTRSPSAWAVDDLYSIIQTVIKDFHVDAKRVYVTGVSLGGMGTWNLAVKYPESFAALVPVCGGHSVIKNAEKLQNTATWAFHAKDDTVVRFSELYTQFLSGLTPSPADELSSIIDKALLADEYSASGTASYSSWMPQKPGIDEKHIVSLFASGGHNIYERAYSEPGLWDWLYKQKLP